jgi:hypothetical protein
MAQTGYTPLLIYASGTASNVPSAANLTSSSSGAELALNYADGKLYFKNSSGVVTLLASSAGASGDVVGPASATDNALARFDTTTGKLIQNSVGILSDAGVLTGLTGLTSSGNITLSALTSGRVPYASTGGLLVDSANLLFDGITLTANALTTTSTVTINGGTANGVAYLNGSKVLTTGSALTFDGTNLSSTGGATFQGGPTGYGGGEVRLGTTASGQQSAISTLSVDSPVLIFDHRGTSNTGVFVWRNGTGGANELARLTSTGLGIGTSSPVAKLDVVGTSSDQIRVGSAATEHYRIGRNASDGLLDFYGSQTGFQGYRFGGIDGTWATINSSGNLGLGVTPSAWGPAGTYTALQIGPDGGAQVNLAGGDASLGSNFYISAVGTRRYQSTGVGASRYQFYNSEHAWFNAPSGTAGNAITFTQAMTLDASGNLGVGTTSPGQKLHVENSVNSSTWTKISNGNSGTGAAAGVLFGTDQGDAGALSQNSSNAGYGTAANAVRLRNLLNAPITFETNNTERARIDSSGRFGIGFNSPNAQLVVCGTGGTGWVGGARNVLQLRNANSSGNRSNYIAFGSASTDANCFILNDINADGTTVNQLNIQAGTSGGVYLADGGTSWTSASDERIKDIIEPISNAVNKVSTIRAVVGKYKSDADGVRRSFLIAQDVQAVFPEAVTVGTDEKQTLGLAYTEVIPLLVAAIQEQQAIIEQLKADVAALKEA